MKKSVFIVLLLMATAFCANAKENPLKGTWKLISVGGQNVPAGTNQIKMITETNFIWTRFNDEGEIFVGAGGKFEVEGNTYTETIVMAFGGMTSFIGQKFVCQYELKDKKLQIKGEGGNSTFAEIWEKID